MDNKQGKNEFLDVKDPRVTLDSLRITKEAQKPKIVRIEQSSLLERARLFLPQIAEANSKLANQPKDKINIENIDENQSGIIKMDLGLGVFDCIDPNSAATDGPIIPNKKDILNEQQDQFNIILNPSELPDDYTKPLIQMLSNNSDDESSDSDSDSDSDSNSDSDTDTDSNDSSENDSDDSDVEMKDASSGEDN